VGRTDRLCICVVFTVTARWQLITCYEELSSRWCSSNHPAYRVADSQLYGSCHVVTGSGCVRKILHPAVWSRDEMARICAGVTWTDGITSVKNGTSDALKSCRNCSFAENTNRNCHVHFHSIEVAQFLFTRWRVWAHWTRASRLTRLVPFASWSCRWSDL